MIDIGEYKKNANYRICARVKYYYDKQDRGWDWDRCVAWAQELISKGKFLRGARPEHQVMARLATPSQDVYVDRLPPKARENFWRLVEWAKTEEATVYTELEGVGYIAPHRNKKIHDYVFVVHAGAQNRMHRDVSRETIRVYRMEHRSIVECIDYANRYFDMHQSGQKIWGITGNTLEEAVQNNLNNHIRNNVYRGRRVYLDRLTKAEKAKLAVLKLMPTNVYLEGYGGRAERHNDVTYIIVGDKK